MNIFVMSRQEFIKYASEIHDETSIVVSISSYSDERVQVPSNLDNGILEILHVPFDDVDKGDNAIKDYQAVSIANFVNKGKNLVDRIIIHCGAGQSRSAGVAGAILKYYDNDDRPIFNNPRYTPNMRCYMSVLNALHSIN